jgi:SWI/SNF-related matrix-associated actin-dependent regulator 1 of chromatin subfamily A
MLTIDANVANARKVFRIATKYSLNIDPAIHEILAPKEVSTTIPGFSFKLLPFQAQGVAWLESHLGTGILADEQGLGKTIQALAYAHKNNKFPLLIVCPNTLKLNWRNEIISTTGNQYKINIVGKLLSKYQEKLQKEKYPNVTYSKTAEVGYDVYIINYEILTSNLKSLFEINFELMVLDESHKIKNGLSQRSMAFRTLATGEVPVSEGGARVIRWDKVYTPIPCVILLSGTPLLNRPVELFSSLNAISRYVPQFSKYKAFVIRYCNPVYNGFALNCQGFDAKTAPELHELLCTHTMLRRVKQDVLTELPEKAWQTIPLEFNRSEYDKVERAFSGMDWRSGMETIVQFGGNPPKSDARIVAIQKLREIAAYAKVDSVIDWIKDYVQEGEKLVVFAHHRAIIDKICVALREDKTLTHSVREIHGEISAEDRQQAVNDFQNNSYVKVIVISISAGGYGLTLTAAKAAAFVQLPWSPGEIQQCADRIHRIGQKNSVTIYNLIAENTIEEDIANLLMHKGKILDAILDKNQKINTIDL